MKRYKLLFEKIDLISKCEGMHEYNSLMDKINLILKDLKKDGGISKKDRLIILKKVEEQEDQLVFLANKER